MAGRGFQGPQGHRGERADEGDAEFAGGGQEDAGPEELGERRSSRTYPTACASRHDTSRYRQLDTS
jgi:hypothetical protein